MLYDKINFIFYRKKPSIQAVSFSRIPEVEVLLWERQNLSEKNFFNSEIF
jgi:hypothetical protein